VAEVDTSTVKIDSDPFYRTPLRETYTANRAKRAAGEATDVDPSFRASKDAHVTESLDDVRGAGGGATGGGFGVPRTAMEENLAGLGMQFQPAPGNGSSVASRPDGSIELLGPPENLTGIVAKASGPAQAVDSGAQQLQMLLMQLKPEAAGAYGKALNDAKQSGSGSGSAGGVNISINRKADGPNVTIEARITAG
jgi:hypothetical protein